jgi:MinD-like ATPase involved in chromosome partitioning or flagellar assembly
MSGKIISVHSFRGGTGKSNISANLSYLLAKSGKRVCVVDTDIQSPGIHMLFQEEKPSPGRTLNDYLWGDCGIDEVAIDVSQRLELPDKNLFLSPCSIDMGDITRILKQGYDISALSKGFKDIRQSLDLDYLILDTHPGLDEETLLSIAISNALLIVLRPDQQDFQGTSVTVEISKRLNVDKTFLVMNRLLEGHDQEGMREKMRSAFACEVAAVLPNCPELAELGSSSLLAMKSPSADWVGGIEKVRDMVI